jgi:DNA-binding transcriptional MerR regulator
LLRRTEAARLLGVSKSTLRRMEGEQLTPVLGPGNVRLFHEEQVQSVIVTRHSRLGSQRSPGDVAADVFALFDSGTHPVDVVKQLRIEPELSEALHARWARMRGLLVLSKESRERIREMMCEGSEAPLATETEVLAFVDKWVMDLAPARCHQCRRDFAGFCAKCAKEWGLRTARRQIAEDRERRL